MNSDWPIWFTNVASASSVLALLVTGYVLWEVRRIRSSFLRRARLPEVTTKLAKATSDLSKNLATWTVSEKPALKNFADARGLLQNLAPKLPSGEQKMVTAFLNRLQPMTVLIVRAKLSDIDEEKAWALYTDLSTVVTRLEQLIKDSKWE